MNGIYWLASYPKSGNTWFRAFLRNLQENTDEPADINALHQHPIAASHWMFEDYTGLSASDLTMDEIDELRPDLYQKIADESKEDLFMKIHDAFTYLPDNRPMIPSKATLGVFYFLRNPLDVAVSFAHHNAGTIDQTISDMKNEKLSIYGNSKKLNSQLRQKLLSWNSHVNSWLNASDVSVYLMRYEDMHLNPIPTFQAAARFANLPDTKERIKKALKFCDFNVLKKQEKDHGFREKIPFAESFFRKGKVGSWRETLSNEQAQKIIDDHRDTMSRFGYLDGNEKPIF
ncbi:MAG: sulfotransferase domain-containing protein [Deltaproteobacteria bacterium]|jgi:hypothetical protein|nr:sulfotransferase domain-containing protein [Deltaproteobacteria bacterium]MBT4640769.1 sulfotransferase domain-containing protein [Deltaproteobacteria bacterium]